MIVIELHYDCHENDLLQNEQLLKHQVKRKALGNNEVDVVNDFINDCMISEMPLPKLNQIYDSAVEEFRAKMDVKGNVIALIKSHKNEK